MATDMRGMRALNESRTNAQRRFWIIRQLALWELLLPLELQDSE